MCSLLAFNTSGRKGQHHSAMMHLLGTDVAFLKNAIRTRSADERARKLRGHVAPALYTNCLTPDAASKLRGRLGFSTSLLIRKLGRGMMGQLIRRQYGANAYFPPSELTRNLLWWRNAIGALRPRSIPLTLFTPMGARSDAQGPGHIATRSLLQPDVSVSTNLPQRFVEMLFSAEEESPIYLSELSATFLTACIVDFRSDGHPRTCVFRIDNKATVDALIKGSSSSALCAIMVTSFGAWQPVSLSCGGLNMSTRNRIRRTHLFGFAIPRRAQIPHANRARYRPNSREFPRRGEHAIGSPLCLTDGKIKHCGVLDGTGGLVKTCLFPHMFFFVTSTPRTPHTPK